MGEALMYPDHPYTIAARKVAEKFIGTSQMIVIAEGQGENALKKEAVLTAIEEFQWHMKQHGAAGSASATSTIKRVFRLLHEGDPNWEILPTRQHDIDTSFFLMSGSPELVRLMVDRYRNTPITLYYRNASNAEAKQAIATAKEFLAATSARGSHVSFGWRPRGYSRRRCRKKWNTHTGTISCWS